jgi:hypothetical protein
VSLTVSELGIIGVAREDVMYRRRCSAEGRQRQNLVFAVAVVTTVIFPIAGLFALLGKFDSAISWHTHGELHALSFQQRRILKQQLLLELVLYPALVIGLAVYYSVHK